MNSFSHYRPTYLFVTVVENEDDGGGEEDGDQADSETEDPVVSDGDVEVEGGEHGAPHHHIQQLVKREERAKTLTSTPKA